MRGDVIIVEEHHRSAAEAIAPTLLTAIAAAGGKYTITVAGESGSGKSETATAIAEVLEEAGISSVILQQDDYFVYPPKANDAERRKDISWVGTQEVKIDLLSKHMKAFLDGADVIEKPLVDYATDSVGEEAFAFGDAQVAIAEGTYTSLVEHVNTRVFIARDFNQTLEHRRKRNRDASELDEFTEEVLKIEHGIISGYHASANIIVNPDYSVDLNPNE